MTPTPTKIENNLEEKLAAELGVTNKFALPKLQKISVNVGMGELHGNEALQKVVQENLRVITGQKPVKTHAKKAIAGFKLREKDVVGYRVTLRSKRMYEFLDRLVTYVFPRLRDFQGLPLKGFDRQGNYTFGLKEHTVFPEVPYSSNDKMHGLQITLVTSAKNAEETKAVLTQFGFPFEKPKEGN